MHEGNIREITAETRIIRLINECDKCTLHYSRITGEDIPKLLRTKETGIFFVSN